MKIKISVIFVLSSIMLLFSLSSFFLCRAYGKYMTEISVGTFDLTIVPPTVLNRVYLMEGQKFNELLSGRRFNRTREIRFDTYSDYPQFKDRRDGINAAVEENNVESDKIKVFSAGSVVYVLSDEVIFSNPDSSGMFRDLSNLESIKFNNFRTDDVIDASNMFYNCRGLTELDITCFDTRNVTNMNSMFRSLSGLTELDISCFDTKNVTNMNSMFRNCRNLAVIYASDKFSTLNVTEGKDMFYNCQSLVGEKGTSYFLLFFEADRSSYVYAKIDGGRGARGYFTEKN